MRREVIRLAPWYHDVEVVPGVRTSAWLDDPPDAWPDSTGPVLGTLRDGDRFKSVLRGVYPGGLDGRRFLDCACNCGVYSLWAKDLGAGHCHGFDIRERWLEQARFLAEHHGAPEDVRFEVCDLYDLPSRGLEPFDVTIFKGILYHLPDPVTGLRIAADLTRELLLVHTTVVEGPPNALIANPESTEYILSGVYRLAWVPTGAEVLRTMLEWCGFPHTRVTREVPAPDWGPRYRKMEVIAARDESTLAGYDGPLADL